MERGAGLAARVRAAVDGMIALRSDLEAGEPWPLSADFGTGPEASWGPPEVLAHVAEMLPFWLGQVERIVAASEPPPFGRTAEDPGRLGTLDALRRRSITELLALVDDGATAYQRRLPGLTAADLARTGTHPVRGVMTVAEVLERLAAAHAEDHLRQLREATGGA
jgi:hypothetical protein